MNAESKETTAKDGRIVWPEGKDFAFTIFDDTDMATLANVGPVYSFLEDREFRTTKSCWMKSGDPNKGLFPGETCEDADYLSWLLNLKSKGFEIAWHGATWHTLPREEVVAALDMFAELFDGYPIAGSHHGYGEEGIYWGDARLTGIRALFYNLLTRFRNAKRFRGHVEGDEHFWGDVFRKRVKYYRNFIYKDINTLLACPFMPYHDPLKPFVNYFYASSDGARVSRFVNCLAEENQDRLEEQGGACIMYTHFSMGFAEKGKLHPRFESLMTRLSKKNGWFVPVSTLLDHLLQTRGPHQITDAQRKHLEWSWLRQKAFTGTT